MTTSGLSMCAPKVKSLLCLRGELCRFQMKLLKAGQPCRATHQSTARRANLSFVPAHRDPQQEEVEQLQQFVSDAKRVLVLTGAGLSTESGIPDYRSEGVGLYARTSRRPMQYQEFIRSDKARQRYWARNFVGWPQFSSFQPNTSHRTLLEWEQQGKLVGLVTQNVDALHTKAGCEDVIELHGCTHRVRCLTCHELTPRTALQTRFESVNPTWQIVEMPIAPDGDVLLDDEQVKDFKVPPCSACGGVLIPDVTFFGDSVPRPKVEKVFGMVDASNALLVCGSSLFVYSGYKFILRAAEMKIPVGIVNIGPTRADHLASLKIEALCGLILPEIKITLG